MLENICLTVDTEQAVKVQQNWACEAARNMIFIIKINKKAQPILQ